MPAPVIVHTNPTEFQGYPVELLRGLAHLGKAIIGDDALFAAVQEYNESATPGGVGVLGPALLTKDCTIVVTSATVNKVPDSAGPAPKPAIVAAARSDDEDPWADQSLDDLLALVKRHGVEVPGRVKTPGKLIAALEAAGVTPG